MAQVPDATIERALLGESLRGATRPDLRLVGSRNSLLATEHQVQTILDRLQADGFVEESGGQWTTTRSGSDRLAELEAE